MKVATMHKTNFTGPPRGFQRTHIDPNIRDRLSNAHWEIGIPSGAPVLNTTASLSYKQRENEYQGQNRLESIKNIKMMRGHHYSMGDNKISYETTSHRKEHSQRVADPSPSPERTIDQAKQELTRHHFDFGHETPAPVTTHQRTFSNKMHSLAQTQKNSRTYLDKINIGEGLNPPLHTTT